MAKFIFAVMLATTLLLCLLQSVLANNSSAGLPNNGTGNGNPNLAHGMQVSLGSVIRAILFMPVFGRIVQ